MAVNNDNVAIIGDWVPPTPTRPTFSSSSTILGEEAIGSRPFSEPLPGPGPGPGPDPDPDPQKELFMGPQQHSSIAIASQNVHGDNSNNNNNNHAFLCSFSDQNSSSGGRGRGGGLLQRMASRAGFNVPPRLNTDSIRSGDLPLNPEIQSPYLTIPPGLSPTTLLDSPVFLSNSLAQRSPTTGKIPFIMNGDIRCPALTSEVLEKSNNNGFDNINMPSFAFKPATESHSSFLLDAATKMTPATLPLQIPPSVEVPIHSENSLHSQRVDAIKIQNQDKSGVHFQVDFTDTSQVVSSTPRVLETVGGSTEHSPPLEELRDEERDQRGSADSMVAGGGAPSEDGYNWRKYGQKQVKGSEYPRSYYKCTHLNCQVKKKVERSHEGHITEIIYKGAHNHPKPPLSRRSLMASASPDSNMPLDIPLQGEPQNDADADQGLATAQRGTTMGVGDSLEATSSASVEPEYGNKPPNLQAHDGTPFESGDAVDASSTFSNEEDDRGTHGSVSLGCDGEGDESESKRRKLEMYATEMSGAARAIREPRVVVQTTSEVDILDDGYRWRKYGQKVVKGNPNPRSYYKCTNAGCLVRKHVERASHDLKSVITTYEGKHNHEVPAARSSSHVNGGAASNSVPIQAPATAIQTQINRAEPPQVHNNLGRFERPVLGAFSLPGRQQLGTSHGFSLGMNEPGLANLAFTGLGAGQARPPFVTAHLYMAQQHSVNEMGFVLPKGEMELEPIPEAGLNLSSGSVYQQIMSRLPLGHHM